MKPSQHSLVMEYVKLNGSIIPAKVSGTPFLGGFFGSETPRRARELRDKGLLKSEQMGKFERFYLAEETTMGDGYLKFKAMGMRLKGKATESVGEFDEFSTEVLEQKKATAEVWLKEHESNIHYAEALARYEKICTELEARETREQIIYEPEKGLYD